MANSNLEATEVNETEISATPHCSLAENAWCKDVLFYVANMNFPPCRDENKKRTLKLKSKRYVLFQNDLMWRNHEGIFLKCLNQEQAEAVMNEFHYGVCGGHFKDKMTTHRILRDGYWWHTLFKDVVQKIRKCDACQDFLER